MNKQLGKPELSKLFLYIFISLVFKCWSISVIQYHLSTNTMKVYLLVSSKGIIDVKMGKLSINIGKI